MSGRFFGRGSRRGRKEKEGKRQSVFPSIRGNQPISASLPPPSSHTSLPQKPLSLSLLATPPSSLSPPHFPMNSLSFPIITLHQPPPSSPHRLSLPLLSIITHHQPPPSSPYRFSPSSPFFLTPIPPLSHQPSSTLSLTQTHPGETRPSRCTASDERYCGG